MEKTCKRACSPFATGCVEIHRRAEPLGGDAATPLSLRDQVGPSFFAGTNYRILTDLRDRLLRGGKRYFAWIQPIVVVMFSYTSKGPCWQCCGLAFPPPPLYFCAAFPVLALGSHAGARLAFCARCRKGSFRWIMCVPASLREPQSAAETWTYRLRT